MRILMPLATLVALAAPAGATPPVPRKAPELTITEPSGAQTLLSSYKGKVVVIEFLHTTCPHCQRASQVFTRLHKELGPRGFQPIGIAFNEGVDPVIVNNFVRQLGADYPIGISPRETVESYLGISVMTRYVVPQIVVIDRKGMIRAQSDPGGTESLQDENSLRNLIDALLKEGATTSNTKKPAPAHRKTS